MHLNAIFTPIQVGKDSLYELTNQVGSFLQSANQVYADLTFGLKPGFIALVHALAEYVEKNPLAHNLSKVVYSQHPHDGKSNIVIRDITEFVSSLSEALYMTTQDDLNVEDIDQIIKGI